MDRYILNDPTAAKKVIYWTVLPRCAGSLRAPADSLPVESRCILRHRAAEISGEFRYDSRDATVSIGSLGRSGL